MNKTNLNSEDLLKYYKKNLSFHRLIFKYYKIIDYFKVGIPLLVYSISVIYALFRYSLIHNSSCIILSSFLIAAISIITFGVIGKRLNAKIFKTRYHFHSASAWKWDNDEILDYRIKEMKKHLKLQGMPSEKKLIFMIENLERDKNKPIIDLKIGVFLSYCFIIASRLVDIIIPEKTNLKQAFIIAGVLVYFGLSILLLLWVIKKVFIDIIYPDKNHIDNLQRLLESIAK